MLDQAWAEHYVASPQWAEVWDQTHSPKGRWPKHIRLIGDKLYLDGKLCLPESLVLNVLAAHHEFMGHLGSARLVAEAQRRYALPASVALVSMAGEVRRTCPVCQACEPPNFDPSTRLQMTCVPDRVFSHVCVDIFSMPRKEWLGIDYDCILLCVDRLSGWMLGYPTQKLGLTAEKTAHLLLDGGWGALGIPDTITSDQGPQFVGKWFQTMCARLGIRQAFSQAHRPQGNGKAEVAGKSIITLLRKLKVGEGANWVEALPRVTPPTSGR